MDFFPSSMHASTHEIWHSQVANVCHSFMKLICTRQRNCYRMSYRMRQVITELSTLCGYWQPHFHTVEYYIDGRKSSPRTSHMREACPCSSGEQIVEQQRYQNYKNSEYKLLVWQYWGKVKLRWKWPPFLHCCATKISPLWQEASGNYENIKNMRILCSINSSH